MASAVVLVAAVATVAVVASAGGDDAREAGAVKTTSTTSTSAPPDTTTTTAAPTGTSAPVSGGEPQASWRTGTLPRADVPEEILDAWERAKNRGGCGLLIPSELGAGMDGATSKASPINDDAGWEISFRRGTGVVQVQGLFDKSTRTVRNEKEIFSRRWADGSLARYGPDARDEEQPASDPETSANEATLILPEQNCAYVIYDSQGKTHMEFILEHLRFVEGTE